MRSLCQHCEKMLQWCCLLLLAFSLPGGDQLEISVGHVFILDCDNFHEDEQMNITWFQEPNQSLGTGTKVINQSLWFFPVYESHNGNYSCSFSEMNGVSTKNHFTITVSMSKCPQPALRVFLLENTRQLLCDSEVMRKISKLKSVSIVGWTWMKDCSPLNWHDKSHKNLRFSSVSKADKGVYTCILNFTYNGTSYTVAHSIQVLISNPGPVPQKPKVIKPRKETLAVKLGSKQVLNCKVFVGPGSCEMNHIEDTKPYWLFNGNFVEKYSQYFVTHNGCTMENKMMYQHSNLSISEVHEEFFNVPFQCRFHSSVGYDNGTLILIQTSQRELYYVLAVLTAYAVVALGFLLFYLFKVDLVLAYRRVSPCLKQQDDGKLYDAYVSCFHGDDNSVSTTFALHVLPEVLEDRLGYKLFISGRNALPGTAVHDVISETVGKSRRLIIVLPTQGLTTSSNNKMKLSNKTPHKEASFNNNIMMDPDRSEASRLNWGPYEYWVGLYDALVKECLKVILVQVGGEVDDSLLPESLRYVKHTQGILKWKQHYASEPNERFWKQMLYRMPPVRKAKTAVTV